MNCTHCNAGRIWFGIDRYMTCGHCDGTGTEIPDEPTPAANAAPAPVLASTSKRGRAHHRRGLPPSPPASLFADCTAASQPRGTEAARLAAARVAGAPGRA